MKRLLLLCCFIIPTSISIWGQDKKNKHTLGLQVSGFMSEISGTDIQSWNNISYGFPIRSESFINSKPAYSIGTTHGYWINNWLKWESSLSFSTMAYRFHSEIIRRNMDAVEKANIEIWTLKKSMSGDAKIFFIEAQTGPHFAFNWKKIRPFVYPYLEVDFYLNNQRQEITEYEDGYILDNPLTKDIITTFNDNYFALGLGLGFEIKIRKRLDLATMLFAESFNSTFYDYYYEEVKTPKNRGISLKINYWLNNTEN